MKHSIDHIRTMLSFHHRNKSTIMENAIVERLNKSLYTYDEELTTSTTYVQNKSELNVLKKL